MELAARIIFWIVLCLILTLAVIFYFEIEDIKDAMRSSKINNELAHDRFIYSLVDIKTKCDDVLKKLDEKEPKKTENEHFYLDDDGYMKCRKTGKNIRYPSLSFKDLDYCPRCGEKLRKE